MADHLEFKPGLEINEQELQAIDEAKKLEWDVLPMDENHRSKTLVVLLKDLEGQILAQGELIPIEGVEFDGEKFDFFGIGGIIAGSAEAQYYPALQSWELILNALNQKFNDVSFYFFGKLQKTEDTDYSSRSGITREKVDQLLSEYKNSVDCFDIGLLNQLAMVQQCNFFLSPHSGFGFAVLAVGTPWLTLSGSRWPEYFYNGVPFYSVLPDPKKYIVYDDKVRDDLAKDIDGENRIRCYSYQRVQEDLPKLLTGADILINKKWSYEKCLKNHFKKMQELYPDKIWSFDYIHEKYVNAK